jgi:sugar lactone lactonase YvrE
MNDGACDPQGRFWAGTMAYDESPGAGALYRLELDSSCTTVLTGLTISNGIGWSPDGATMYLADSGTGQVEAFGFDGATGDLSGRRILVRIEQPGVVPDGLTVDQEGGIWVALWGVVLSRAMEPTGRCWPWCACPLIDRRHAPSGNLSLPRCLSRPPGPDSTRPRSTASPTPAMCFDSTVSA